MVTTNNKLENLFLNIDPMTLITPVQKPNPIIQATNKQITKINAPLHSLSCQRNISYKTLPAIRLIEIVATILKNFEVRIKKVVTDQTYGIGRE